MHRLACFAVLLVLSAGAARAQVSDDVVKIGVLTDLSGPAATATGPGSVAAAQMAVEDFGGKVLGKPIAIISAAAGILGGGRMQYDLRRSMIFLDAWTMNKPEIFIGNVSQKIDEKTGQIKDEQAIGFIKQQLAAFAKFIAQHGGKN